MVNLDAVYSCSKNRRLLNRLSSSRSTLLHENVLCRSFTFNPPRSSRYHLLKICSTNKSHLQRWIESAVLFAMSEPLHGL